MADSYVCSGATMKCTMGTSNAKLTVLPIRTVNLTGKPMANISDHLTMINLAPFGRCRSLGFPATAAATAAHHGKLTPMPCMHNTPFPWMKGKNDYLVKGDPALLKSSTCQCMWGGTISLITDGQTPPSPADLSRKPKTSSSHRRSTYARYSGSGSGREQSENNTPIYTRQQGATNSLFQGAKDFVQGVKDRFKDIKDQLGHKKYLLSVLLSKGIYTPEQPDIALSNSLKSLLNQLDAINTMKTMSHNEKIDYVQNTLRPMINNTMGINMPEYNWMSQSRAGAHVLGYYSERDRAITLNSEYLKDNDDAVLTILLNTIIHESKHARQWDAVAGRADFGYSKNLIDSWRKNFYNYISSAESDEGYMKQPVELDAWMFAEGIIPDGLI